MPAIEQQTQIGKVLKSLDDKIELNNQINETLESMSKAIFKEWFIDFGPVKSKAEGKKPFGMDDKTASLFPESFEDSELGQIPRGWKCGTLADLCVKVETGGTPKRDEPSYWDKPDISWLTSGEVRKPIITKTGQFISKLGFENSAAKKWPPLTTVVAMYGATAGQATIIAKEMTANQACCGLLAKNFAASFVYLTARNSTQIWESRARGSAQQNLNKSLVSELEIVVPPEGLLKTFNNLTVTFLEQQIQNTIENENLEALRDLVLPKLISGNLELK